MSNKKGWCIDIPLDFANRDFFLGTVYEIGFVKKINFIEARIFVFGWVCAYQQLALQNLVAGLTFDEAVFAGEEIFTIAQKNGLVKQENDRWLIAELEETVKGYLAFRTKMQHNLEKAREKRHQSKLTECSQNCDSVTDCDEFLTDGSMKPDSVTSCDEILTERHILSTYNLLNTDLTYKNLLQKKENTNKKVPLESTQKKISARKVRKTEPEKMKKVKKINSLTNSKLTECSQNRNSVTNCDEILTDGSQKPDSVSVLRDPTDNNPKALAKLEKKISDSTAVFENYANSMLQVYGVKVPRNAKINSQIKKLIEYVGIEKAKQLAAFYPTYKEKFYLETAHPFGLLLKDYVKLQVSLETGLKLTPNHIKEIIEKDNSVYDNARLRNESDRIWNSQDFDNIF